MLQGQSLTRVGTHRTILISRMANSYPGIFSPPLIEGVTKFTKVKIVTTVQILTG
jgi:hypothetical protein